MDNEIMLSIMIPTYNHEHFIRKALDSVFMQETEYVYEVLVGEDASTDKTREVLKEYERNHNFNNLFVFYRECNMSNGPISNQKDLRTRCRGKYIITLEGDDFWIDRTKIQRQIDFLETHPDYVAVAHNCVVVNENDEKKDLDYPECKKSEYTIKDYLLGIMPGQTATIMSVNFMKIPLFDLTVFDNVPGPGDRIKYFALVTNGKIYCEQRTMSAYRLITKYGSSYTANYKYNFENDYLWHKRIVEFAHGQNKGIFTAEALYIGAVLYGLREKKIEIQSAFNKVKQDLIHPMPSFLVFLYRWVNLHIFKRGN